MKLYFMRHGKAVDAPLADNDFDRALTDKGAKRVRRMSQWMGRMGILPAAIFASPRVRAQQTAKILAEVMGKSILTREEINFDFHADYIETLVTGYGHDAEIVFVGHNPSMSDVVRRITGANINMEVGSVACTLVTPYNLLDGELAWYMTWHCIKAGEE